VIFESFGSLSN